MKYAYLIVFLSACMFSACEKDSPNASELEIIDYLIFGHFYGFCGGEECIEIFKIDENGLSEDRNDDYPDRMNFYQGNFEVINQDVSQVNELKTTFPTALFDEEQILWGCPDCADQGGYYVEIAMVEGTRRMWVFDTTKSELPEYVHDYVDLIQRVIQEINE